MIKKLLYEFSDTTLGLTLREMAFKLICHHENGDKPNILLFCTRRSGSTWILNTLCAHPGMRYVGKPFLQAMNSRHKKIVPSLAKAAGNQEYDFEIFVDFPKEDLPTFDAFVRKLLLAEIEVYPTLRINSDYFHRKTDRVVYQVTNALPLAERLGTTLPVQSILLLRHPISNALSIMKFGWRDECKDFMLHDKFRDEILTEKQVDLSYSIMKNGDILTKHVLDWCFKNMLVLRAMDEGRLKDWLIVTYEETSLEPEKTVKRMAHYLSLPNIDSMLSQVKRPSATVNISTIDKINDKDFLVGRWRHKVSPEQTKKLFKILEAFEIDAYDNNSLVAKDNYLSSISRNSFK